MIGENRNINHQDMCAGNRATVALVTGASRGIGKAIAETFAKTGYDLILTCSNSIDTLDKYAGELTEKYGISCRAIEADMGNAEDVLRVFSEIERLDVLVNNAGISYVGLLSDMSIEEWQHIMSVNLDSCFYTSKCAIPLMLKEHAGRIINISSVWGNVGASMEVAYSASKGGMNAFTKALAKELAPSNIQVNAVACGVIDTAMNACFTEEDMADLTADIPADRIGKPEEVAQLVLQLAQAPTYMTGQIITIDGGWQ
ncbi:MAG: SDR family NAD(P)-dependent oxidoreductase [Lachnospiraceae bacterium]|nr:SDR family NAD(P)-dependent oxidoreductase [Lachnospiraceae bacterium]